MSIGYFKSSFFLEIISVCSCFSDPFHSISNGLTLCLSAPLPLKKVTFIHYLQSQFWGFRDKRVLLTRKMSQQHRQEFRYLNACVSALWWLLLFYIERGKEQKETGGAGEGGDRIISVGEEFPISCLLLRDTPSADNFYIYYKTMFVTLPHGSDASTNAFSCTI